MRLKLLEARYIHKTADFTVAEYIVCKRSPGGGFQIELIQKTAGKEQKTTNKETKTTTNTTTR